MTTPKISVLIYTARSDHPYPDTSWHCFDPFLKTLAAQRGAPPFELVLVDMLWETRRDYFEKHPQPFPVKHVPSSPNRWQSQRRTGLCEQINRGFAWADGDLIWMGGENNMFPPGHFARAWSIHEQGKIPLAWYAICADDPGRPRPESTPPTIRDDIGIKRHSRFPADANFDLLGYTPLHVNDMDHRGFQFVDNPKLEIADGHHQNYFGYSSVPTAAAVKINGFDELFDGQWGLFDCDFGSRLDMAGCKFAFARDLYVVEPPVAPGPYSGIGHHEAFKCHYAIYLHNRHGGRGPVNRPLLSTYVDDVKRVACFDKCEIKDRCAGKEPGIGEQLYYPFVEGKNRELAMSLMSNPPVRDLAADRVARVAGAAPFDRGTFSSRA